MTVQTRDSFSCWIPTNKKTSVHPSLFGCGKVHFFTFTEKTSRAEPNEEPQGTPSALAMGSVGSLALASLNLHHLLFRWAVTPNPVTGVEFDEVKIIKWICILERFCNIVYIYIMLLYPKKRNGLWYVHIYIYFLFFGGGLQNITGVLFSFL